MVFEQSEAIHFGNTPGLLQFVRHDDAFMGVGDSQGSKGLKTIFRSPEFETTKISH